MANLQPRNMAWLRANMPRLHETVSDMVRAIGAVGAQVNAEPVGVTAPPPSISGLTVVGGAGVFDARISDLAPVNRGVEYHLEYATTPDFASSHLVHLGPSRNWRSSLGRQKLYFRAHSTYPTSAPSSPVHHGGVTPGMVDGTLPIEPVLQAGAGSGTGSLSQVGQGYGTAPYRSSNGLPPVKA